MIISYFYMTLTLNFCTLPQRDLHNKPFSESTLAKLDIFDSYIEAWLPTFIHSPFPTICIFDFFSGNGYQDEVPGSSIRILKNIRIQVGNIFKAKKEVKVFLNEFEPGKKNQLKFSQLKSSCEEYLEKNKDVKRAIQIFYSNEDFQTLFPKLLPEIKKYPSLIFLDQNGIKFLSDEYLLKLEQSNHTDFLYFVSSSYFNRFGQKEEFSKYLNLDMEEIKKTPYQSIHKLVVQKLRDNLPNQSGLKLYPFSLKKGANIYGIIFGAKHPRAVDKFLNIAWKKNPVNGDANFDIDKDALKYQNNIFTGEQHTKIETFKISLQEKIFQGSIKNNFDALQFAYNEGHIGKHAADCLKEMKKNNIIFYEGPSPLITYDNVFKNNKKINYTLTRDET